MSELTTMVAAINEYVNIYGYTKAKANIIDSDLFDNDETTFICNWIDCQEAISINEGK
jgi:hypothetical protein